MTVEIYRIDKIHFILKPPYSKDTFAFIDIDETLITYISNSFFSHFGEDPFNQHVPAHLKDKKIDSFKKNQAIYHAESLRSIESKTTPTLRALESRVTFVFLLTARYAKHTEETFAHLKANDCLPTLKTKRHDGEHLIDSTRSYTLKDHVIFANENNKGEIIHHFVSQIREKPTSVVFVDNAKQNITDVITYLSKTNFDLYLFHYIRVEEHQFSSNSWRQIIEIQAKLFIYNSEIINDIAVKLFIDKVKKKGKDIDLKNALDPSRDSTLLKQLFSEFGEVHELIKID